MNIQQIKFVTWIAALAAGGGLGWVVYDYFERQPELEVALDVEMVRTLLTEGVVEPEPLKVSHVDSKQLTRIFHVMDWSGQVQVKAPDVVEVPVTEREKPKVSVATLLLILVLQEDRTDPSASVAYVKYTDAALRAKSKELGSKLSVDDRLAEPYEYVRVAGITAGEGIRFAFDDEDREEEFVASISFPTESGGIVAVGDGGALMPVPDRKIGVSTSYVPFRPKHTRSTGHNSYTIGTETAATIDRDFSKILSQDVQYRKARDKVKGTVRGIQITKVAPNSLPAQHGITAGEIVISINGHSVKSVSDAVAYVKQESNTTDVWDVLFEKQGKQFTRTYRSPDQ